MKYRYNIRIGKVIKTIQLKYINILIIHLQYDFTYKYQIAFIRKFRLVSVNKVQHETCREINDLLTSLFE